MSIRTIGIMANSGKAAALEVAQAANRHLHERGIKVLLPRIVAEAVGTPELGLSDDHVAEADAVIVLGGDGTILATARLCAPRGTPMLPVHLGRFGFLTEVAPERIDFALDALLRGDYQTEDRLMLWGRAVRGEKALDLASNYALNDIVVANGPLSRVLHLRLSVNGKYVTTYSADGLIIATPTGSTAYSLSAGGPLVHPSLQTLLVTPICAHALTARPLLLPRDAQVSVRVEQDSQDMIRVTVDGQIGFPLQASDEVHICAASHSAKILTVGGADFFDKLQNKLHWGENLY